MRVGVYVDGFNLYFGAHDDGVGNHWWARIDVDDLDRAQLPARVGRLRRPPEW